MKYSKWSNSETESKIVLTRAWGDRGIARC